MEAIADVYVKGFKIPKQTINYVKLKRYIEVKDFGRAVVLVQNTISKLGDNIQQLQACIDILISI
jgi:hypothetical protein